MSSSPPPHVDCPRCHYDLRAAREPRCPECGLAFTWEQWRDGLIRDERPSLLDTCDLWQPHAVLLRALTQLASGIGSPRMLVSRLDLRPRAAVDVLAFVAMTFWLFIAHAMFWTAYALAREALSPFAAARYAVLWAAPMTTLYAVVAGLAATLVIPRTVLRRAHVGHGERWRIGSHAGPVFGAYVSLAFPLIMLADPSIDASLAVWLACWGGCLLITLHLVRRRAKWLALETGSTWASVAGVSLLHCATVVFAWGVAPWLVTTPAWILGS